VDGHGLAERRLALLVALGEGGDLAGERERRAKHLSSL
jgi:hypothetical protein